MSIRRCSSQRARPIASAIRPTTAIAAPFSSPLSAYSTTSSANSIPRSTTAPNRSFPFVTGPCDSGVFWRHHEFVQRLEAAESDPPEPLWADVTALQLIADVLEAAFARHGLPRPRRRNGTDADHADRAEAAKTYLASRLGERVTLDEVARAVSCVALSFRSRLSAANRHTRPSLPDPAAPPRFARTPGRRCRRSHRARPRPRLFQPQPLHRHLPPRIRPLALRDTPPGQPAERFAK